VIRAFVAIAPTADATAALVAAQAGLPAGRAVEAGSLHLTLAFLGELPEPAVEDVHYALGAVRQPGFEISLAGLSLMEAGRGLALCAGAGPSPELERLRDKVAQAARSAGVRLDRTRFRPHVTLARLGAQVPAGDEARLRAFAARGSGFRAAPMPVREFALVRSRLGRERAVYETLATYHLGPPVAATS
jgi:2'-5' RNA ligase